MQSMGQLEDMALFIRIVEAGGISKASSQLNIAKSAVSRRLSDLESRLKVQLINRNTRNWNLTDVGSLYYKRAKSVLQDVSCIDAEVMEEEASAGGLIKVSIPMSFGLQGLSSVFDKFMLAHPNVRFSVDLSDQIIDLVEHGIDVAIRIADLEDSSLRARHLSVIRHLLVATPDYLESNGTPATIEELVNHDFLKYSLTRASTIIATDENQKSIPLRVNPIVSANNADFLKKMTLMHRGIAYLPSFLVAEDIVNGKLVAVLTDFDLPILNAYAIYPNVKYLSKRTRALIDFIIDHCGQNPFWDRSISEFKNANLG